jgi:O-antigen ligase/tetratricopeptide (TPR) repeat protein
MTQWNPSHRSHQRGHSSHSKFREQFLAASLNLVDASIAGIIFVGPHVFGGRHLLGRFVILACCVVAAVAWFGRQLYLERPRWHRTKATLILVAATLLVAFQLVPLPADWLATLTPRTAHLLPLWNGEAARGSQFGSWETISLSPEDTRLALATLLGYGLLFVTVVQRIDSIDDIMRFVRWISCSAMIVATFGIVQYFTSNGKFFWFYEHPYADTYAQVKGGFTGRNHFAHFLVLGLANTITWATMRGADARKSATQGRSRQRLPIRPAKPERDTTKIILLVGMITISFAILASMSRGGTLAMAGAISVIAVCYARIQLLRKSHLFAGGSILVLIMLALSIGGNYEAVSQRLESLTSNSLDKIDADGGRRLVWSANLAAAREGGLLGSGAGSHRFIYPAYMTRPVKSEYTHAENGYLQVLTENGPLGLSLLLVGIGVFAFCCEAALRSARSEQLGILASGIAATLAASVVHSVVDFVWFIPACATITVVMGACAVRLYQHSVNSRSKRSVEMSPAPITRFNFALGVTFAAIWTLMISWPAAKTSLEWDRYLLADQVIQAGEAELDDAAELNLHSALQQLQKVVHDYPNSARAHLRLAGNLINHFERLQQVSENPMSISQIRDAAQASQFATSDELRQWLTRAFGNNPRLLYAAYNHALQAVKLCPLQGEGYLYLAELSFLKSRPVDTSESLYQQSLHVCPVDTSILFAVGNHEFIQGHIDPALALWARAFQGTGIHQHRIIDVLAGRMSAANFVKLFQPDWSSLDYVWQRFREVGSLADAQVLLPYAVEHAGKTAATVPSYKAGMIWLKLARIQNDMGETHAALDSFQLAYGCSPDSFPVRYELGCALLQCRQFDAAESHFRWCYNHQPESRNVQKLLQLATRGRMQQLSRNINQTAFQ